MRMSTRKSVRIRTLPDYNRRKIISYFSRTYAFHAASRPGVENPKSWDMIFWKILLFREMLDDYASFFGALEDKTLVKIWN